MKTLATLFTGGGLFDIGAKAAGYETIWGMEWDDKIATVARMNGLNVLTADVTKADFTAMPRPHHLHASPPCPNFSVAKANAEETPFDLEMAKAVCRAIVQLKPFRFTLENVVPYQNSQSFLMILKTLSEHGYFYDVQSLNAADFGVPQTRNRLFVRASKTLLMQYPAPSKWIGWYDAIEDLLPTLPNTDFAPWQVERLPLEYKDFIIGQGARSSLRRKHEPVQTITSNNNQSTIKAFILPASDNTSFAEAEPGKGVRYQNEPVHTLASGEGGRIPRAFLVSGGNSNRDTFKVRQQQQPHFTVTASINRGPSRAFVGAGRVVKMTIRALGRFQTVPDDYVGLTTKINGNGVPCKVAEVVMRTFGE